MAVIEICIKYDFNRLLMFLFENVRHHFPKQGRMS